MFKDSSQLTSISSYAFESCQNLVEIRLPPLLLSIDQYAFSGCNNLKRIELSSNSHNITTLTTLSYSFSNIDSAFSLITNNKAICFQSNTFYNSRITHLELYFSQDISFSGNVFNGTQYLNSITIPDCIRTITRELFNNCSNLQCIMFSPNSDLRTIESSSFISTCIRTLYMPPYVYSIGDYIFKSSISNPVIYYAGSSITLGSFYQTPTVYVKNEYSGTTYSCITKTSYNIINSKAYYCEFETEKSTFVYNNINYSIINNEKKEVIVIHCTYTYSYSYLTIPQSFTYDYTLYTVVGIGRSSFYNNRYLNEIILPNCLRFIEEYAFYECTNLRYVYNLCAQSIGKYAFYRCNIYTLFIAKYEYNEIRAFVNNRNYVIGDYAFANCTNLRQMFNTNSNDNNLVMIYPREIGKFAFADCIQLIETPYLDDVFCIHQGAFRNTNITSINISRYTEVIEEEAFASCKSLTIFNARNNSFLTNISDSCFKDCVELKYVFLPEVIERIGNYSFKGCTKLYSINLYRISSIGYQAFYDCPCFIVEYNGTIEPSYNSSFTCSNHKNVISNTYRGSSFCGICIAYDCKCNAKKPKEKNEFIPVFV